MADLHERVVPLPGQAFHGRPEQHRALGVVTQVLRAEDRLPLGGDGAHEGDGRVLRGQRTGRVGEPVGDRPHQR